MSACVFPKLVLNMPYIFSTNMRKERNPELFIKLDKIICLSHVLGRNVLYQRVKQVNNWGRFVMKIVNHLFNMSSIYKYEVH